MMKKKTNKNQKTGIYISLQDVVVDLFLVLRPV
jgi:hypothetical protein